MRRVSRTGFRDTCGFNYLRECLELFFFSSFILRAGAVFVISSTDYFSCTGELLPESGGSLGVDSRVRVGHVIRHVCRTARGVARLAALRGSRSASGQSRIVFVLREY